jgi:hypothetical protein
MSVRMIRIADRDALKAARWYERRQRGLGGQFLDELERALATVEANPGCCPRYEFSPTNRVLYRHRLKRFPYLLILEPHIDELVVVAVHPLARNTGYLKRRRS